MAPQEALTATKSELDREVDAVLYRVIMGHTTTVVGLRNRITDIAETQVMTYSQVKTRLVERFTFHHQAGEYTDEMVRVIPEPIVSALGLSVEAQ